MVGDTSQFISLFAPPSVTTRILEEHVNECTGDKICREWGEFTQECHYEHDIHDSDDDGF